MEAEPAFVLCCSEGHEVSLLWARGQLVSWSKPTSASALKESVMSLEAYVQIAVIFVAFVTGMIFLRGSLRDIRGEIKDVRTEIKDVRTEIKDVRTELKDGLEAVHTRIEAVHTKIDGVQQQVAGQGERLARIEGMLTPQNGRFSAQEEAVSAEPNPSPQPRAARSA